MNISWQKTQQPLFSFLINLQIVSYSCTLSVNWHPRPPPPLKMDQWRPCMPTSRVFFYSATILFTTLHVDKYQHLYWLWIISLSSIFPNLISRSESKSLDNDELARTMWMSYNYFTSNYSWMSCMLITTLNFIIHVHVHHMYIRQPGHSRFQNQSPGPPNFTILTWVTYHIPHVSF